METNAIFKVFHFRSSLCLSVYVYVCLHDFYFQLRPQQFENLKPKIKKTITMPFSFMLQLPVGQDNITITPK